MKNQSLSIVFFAVIFNFCLIGAEKNDQNLKDLFLNPKLDSIHVYQTIDSYLGKLQLSEANLNVQIHDLIIAGLEQCENLDQVFAFNEVIVEAGLAKLFKLDPTPMPAIQNMVSDLTRSNISWALTHSVELDRILKNTAEYVSSSVYKFQGRQSTISSDRAVITGFINGIQYMSNRLYLEKTALISNVLKGLAYSISKFEDIEASSRIFLRAYMDTTFEKFEIEKLKIITRTLGEAIGAGLLGIRDGKSTVDDSVIDRLEKASSQLIQESLDYLYKNDSEVRLSFGMITKFKGDVQIHSNASSSKGSNINVNSGSAVIEGYSIQTGKKTSIQILFENGLKLSMQSDSKLKIIKLVNDFEGRNIPLIELEEGQFYFDGNLDQDLAQFKIQSGIIKLGSARGKIIINNKEAPYCRIHQSSGYSMFVNKLNKKVEIQAGEKFVLETEKFRQKPEWIVMDQKEIANIDKTIKKQNFNHSTIQWEIVKREVKKIGENIYNAKFGVVANSIALGMAEGIADECTLKSLKLGSYKELCKALARGIMNPAMSFSEKNDMNTPLLASYTSNGIFKGISEATKNSGYGSILVSKSDPQMNDKLPYTEVSAFSDRIIKNLFVSKIGNDELLKARKQLSEIVIPEVDRIRTVLESSYLPFSKSDPIASWMDSYIPEIQKHRNLNRKDALNVVLISLLDELNKNMDLRVGILFFLDKLLTKDFIENANFESILPNLLSSTSQYLFHKSEIYNLLESSAFLSNSLSEVLLRRIQSKELKRLDLNGILLHSLGSSLKLYKDQSKKIDFIKGITYGFAFSNFRSILSSSSSVKKADELLTNSTREWVYGIMSLKQWEADSLPDLLGRITDVLTSSLISTSSKFNQSDNELAEKVGSLSKGIASAAIEADIDTQLPVDQLGAVFMDNAIGDIKLDRYGSTRDFKEVGISKIHQGFSVITGDQSQVDLIFSNGTSITLLEKSRLDIQEFLQDEWNKKIKFDELKEEPSISKTRLELAFGDLIFDVKKLNQKSSMLIKTPAGITKIQGTSGKIGAKRNLDGSFSGTTDLLTGKVAITSLGGQIMDLNPGQKVNFVSVRSEGVPNQRFQPILMAPSLIESLSSRVKNQKLSRENFAKIGISTIRDNSKSLAKNYVSSNVARRSQKIALKISSSSLVAVQRSGNGSDINKFLRSCSRGILSSALKQASDKNLDLQKISYFAARGNALGNRFVVGQKNYVLYERSIGNESLDLIQTLQSDLKLGRTQVLELEGALEDGFNSLDSKVKFEVEKYGGDRFDSIFFSENILNTGDILVPNNEELPKILEKSMDKDRKPLLVGLEAPVIPEEPPSDPVGPPIIDPESEIDPILGPLGPLNPPEGENPFPEKPTPREEPDPEPDPMPDPWPTLPQDPILYSIQLNSSPSAGGSVSGGGSFSPGTTHNISASASSGYEFTGWSPSSSVANASSISTSVTMTQNHSITANFKLISNEEEAPVELIPEDSSEDPVVSPI